jgi:type II secretory pathway component PulF
VSFTLFGAMRDLDESRHRAELYRAWAVGLGAGFTSPFALEQMGRIVSARTEAARTYLLLGLKQDKAVGQLVKARPKLFRPFETAILAAGDESGTLPIALGLLADHFAREFKRVLKVRSLMLYPIFLGIAAAFSLTTPFLHRGGIRVYLTAIAGALVALLFMGGIPIAIIAAVLSGRAVYSVPRFARALAIGAEMGLPAGRFMRLAVGESGSPDLRRHIAKRSDRQLSVMPIAVVFEGCWAVPPALLAQMKVADATGDYAGTFKGYADSLGNR